jgi:hypothetical protein
MHTRQECWAEANRAVEETFTNHYPEPPLRRKNRLAADYHFNRGDCDNCLSYIDASLTNHKHPINLHGYIGPNAMMACSVGQLVGMVYTALEHKFLPNLPHSLVTATPNAATENAAASDLDIDRWA